MPELIFSNINILGNWNPKIFSPEWVGMKLFGLKNISPKFDANMPEGFKKFEVSLNINELEVLYKYEDILILPKINSFEIIINSFIDEKFLFANDILLKIFNLLPETPIKGLGFNFRYKFNKEENNKIVDCLGTIPKIKNLELNSIKYIIKEEFYIINIFSENINDGKEILFNFHYENASQIKLIDKNTIIILLNKVKEIIESCTMN